MANRNKNKTTVVESPGKTKVVKKNDSASLKDLMMQYKHPIDNSHQVSANQGENEGGTVSYSPSGNEAVSHLPDPNQKVDETLLKDHANKIVQTIINHRRALGLTSETKEDLIAFKLNATSQLRKVMNNPSKN